MKFRLSPELVENIPGLTVAVLVLRNVHNERYSSAVGQLLRGACAIKKKALSDPDNLKNLHSQLEKLSFEDKTLPEIKRFEKDIVKVLQDNLPEPDNNLNCLTKFFSIKNQIPMQAKDLDELKGDLEISFFTPQKNGEPEDVHLHKDTHNFVAWFINVGVHSKEEFDQLPKDYLALVNKYCGCGEHDIYYLTANMPEVDLEYGPKTEEIETEEPEPSPPPRARKRTRTTRGG